MHDSTFTHLTDVVDTDLDRLSGLIAQLYDRLAPFRRESDTGLDTRPLDQSPVEPDVERLRDIAAELDLANFRLAQLLAELGG